MKKFLSMMVLAPFLFVALYGCAGSQIANTITPTVAQTLGYDAGYYGWTFTTMAPVSQLAINAACSLVPKASTDPQSTITELMNLFQQDWTAAYTVLTGKYSPLIIGAAQAAINEINALVGQLTSAQSLSTSVASQYATAILSGICQGVAAAQGKTPAQLKADVVKKMSLWEQITSPVECWYCAHVRPVFVK